MEDIRYKQYSEEESRIYNEAMDNIMGGLQKGLNFDEACAATEIGDADLKAYVVDDALKILIADMHFVKGLPLQHVADTYGVSMDAVVKASREMMEDIEATTSEIYRSSQPGGHVGNA
jgi:hypothetical protein